jgi:hypothetical protein
MVYFLVFLYYLRMYTIKMRYNCYNGHVFRNAHSAHSSNLAH